MEIHTLSIFSNGEVSVSVPTSARLAYVKSDWDTFRWGFAPRPAAPDPGIFPVSKTPEIWEQTDFCWFGKDWQWCEVDLLSMQMYGRLFTKLGVKEKSIIVNVFLKLTQSDRAYNNYHGTDKYNCYVSVDGKPIIRGEDAKWESLITCGNEVELLEQRQVLTGKNMGRDFVRLNSFYANEKPPVVTKELLNDPRVHYAKNVNPAPNSSSPNYLTNFHYGEWPVGMPMPIVFLTNGPHWYDLRELKLL